MAMSPRTGRRVTSDASAVAIVTPAEARTLAAQHPALPNWRTAAGDIKLSAAWLLEQCGFKGLRSDDAGFAERHALVLVNYDRASGEELWALARRAQRAVRERFDIELEPEPRII
jgi:UDP-N-acetylmuramate dehydrogenase